jgi:hypothetical protein
LLAEVVEAGARVRVAVRDSAVTILSDRRQRSLLASLARLQDKQQDRQQDKQCPPPQSSFGCSGWAFFIHDLNP